jgi:hypothetical protein
MHRPTRQPGLILVTPSLSAAQNEWRIALVVGNAACQQGACPVRRPVASE